jgi:tetratricopeptide (TPR) repeat protein
LKKIAFFILVVCFYQGFSQINHPKASPLSKIEQTVGLSKITITYSRPAARGRTIFGNRADGQPALVPYGRIWRVGANESTKITFDSEVNILGNSLSKGTYAIYAFPEANEWQLVFHNNTTHWGDGRTAYNPEEDALRVTVHPKQTLNYQENFLISFDDITHHTATLNLHWAGTEVSLPMTFNTQELMEAQIEEELKGSPTAQTYYEIARYYQEQDSNLPQALMYLNKAIELGGDTYYFHRVKSLVQAKLEDYKGAIQSAEKSLQIAQDLGKDEFVRMNRKNSMDWNEKLKQKN